MAGGSGQIRAGRAFVEFAVQGQDTVRKAFVRVQASLAAFMRATSRIGKRGVQYFKSLGTAVAGVGSKLLAMGKYAAFALGALAGAVLTNAIKQASDFGETVSKFNIVFGDNAKAMRAWAEEYGAAIGRSKKEMLDFMSTSQGFLIPMGIDEAQATKMSQVLTQLSFDLGSFHNIADDEAFEKIRAGLSGEAEPLKVLGVVLNEAAMKAELLKHGLDPSTATEAQKVMARYNIILASTAMAQGDAERTSDSFANKVKALHAAWDDFLVILGEKVLPYAAMLVDWLTKLLRATDLTSASVNNASGSLENAGASSQFLVTALDWMIHGWHLFNATIQTAFALVQGFFALLVNLSRFMVANPLTKTMFGEDAIKPLEDSLLEAEKWLTTEAQKRLEDAGKSLDALDDEGLGEEFLAGFRSSMDQASADLKKVAEEASETVAVPFEAIENFGPAINKAKKKAEEVKREIEIVSPESLEGMAAFEQFRENARVKEMALLAKAAEALRRAIENPAIALATVE